MKAIYLAFGAALALTACSQPGWSDQDQKDFVGNCTSSYISSFKSTLGDMMSEVNEDKLNEVAASYCSCSYEKIKKKYETPEEAFKKTTEQLMQDCVECDPTDKDIDELLIK